MIECRLLGPPQVVINGAPAPPEVLWRKHLALLIYLACSRRGRSREHLVSLLWPDKGEGQARHSLNEALRVIRRVAGDEAVVSDSTSVQLAPEQVQVDLNEFEALFAAGRLEDAATLLAGDFAEGLVVPGASDFDNWLSGERARWRERGCRALVAAGSAALDRGDLVAARDASARALAAEPLSESALRLALSSVALAGERSSALEMYAEFEARLGQSTGATPDRETAALVSRIRQDRLGRRERRVPEPETEGSRRAPLIGRTRELSALLEVWRAAVERRSSAVAVVRGDAGVGKTRLVEELSARARLDGAVTLSVLSLEADQTTPEAILAGLARDGLVEVPGIAGAPAGALAGLVSRLAEWEARFPTVRADPLPLPAALRECLRAVGEERPILLVIDNAQWADRDSLLALEALLRDLRSVPLLIAFAAAEWPERPELDQLRARIPRDLAGQVVTLNPLSTPEILALARWALPAYDEAELERITRRIGVDAAGYPLLVVELLSAVGLGLDLPAVQAWPAPSRTLSQTLPGDLPDAVVAAFRVGFRRLSPQAQQVLVAAAVLPEPVLQGQLARVTGLPEASVADALDELEWQRWLVCDSRGYSFVARIARLVIERDMITPGQRRRIVEQEGTS